MNTGTVIASRAADDPGLASAHESRRRADEIRYLCAELRCLDRADPLECLQCLAQQGLRFCRLADGLPLAIELAAAHARTLPLSGIRDGMADRMAFLAARRPGGLPRHGSVAASLDWSAELVPPHPSGEGTATVEDHAGPRCERCWKHYDQLAASPNDVCERCAAALAARK